MMLAKELMQKTSDSSRTHNGRAALRCQLAKEFEDVGNYEAAREAMSGLWSRVGERPNLDALDQKTAGMVLLRTGVLTGWLGSSKQIEGSQEIAKNLISESLSIFRTLGSEQKAAEALIELGYCYWRQGAFEEARVCLKEGLTKLTGDEGDLKATAMLRYAAVEKVSQRLNDALRILSEAAPLFERSSNYTLKGRFHNELGTVLENLSRAEHRGDYIDQAFVEYTAAIYYFERAGHRRYQACVENNLGFLFSTVNKYNEAHEHLDFAQALLTSLKDSVHLSQVDETRARVFLAEGRAAEAEKLARIAAQTLERGGEQALLAEALRTWGAALARLGRVGQAGEVLKRAWEVAEQAGDLEGAGQAAVMLVEELGGELGLVELVETFERADELLAGSRYPGNKERLLACARRVLVLVGPQSRLERWRGFSFEEAVRLLARQQKRIEERDECEG